MRERSLVERQSHVPEAQAADPAEEVLGAARGCTDEQRAVLLRRARGQRAHVDRFAVDPYRRPAVVEDDREVAPGVALEVAANSSAARLLYGCCTPRYCRDPRPRKPCNTPGPRRTALRSGSDCRPPRRRGPVGRGAGLLRRYGCTSHTQRRSQGAVAVCAGFGSARRRKVGLHCRGEMSMRARRGSRGEVSVRPTPSRPRDGAVHGGAPRDR